MKVGHPAIITASTGSASSHVKISLTKLTPQRNQAPISEHNDQRTAFLWIKSLIPEFGGNFDQITAFGESVGSGSIAFHTCSDVPLFNRTLLMSGLPATMPPLSLVYKESDYCSLFKYCGIDQNDPARLEKLLKFPGRESG